MPVNIGYFDVLAEEATPKRPRSVVWILLLVVFVVVGSAIAVFMWPDTAPLRASIFWVAAIGCPVILWSLLLGLRLHGYEEACHLLAAENETLEAYRKQAIEFAKEPLGVLDFGYVSEFGTSGLAGAIAKGEQSVEYRKPKPDMQAVRYTALVGLPDEDQSRRTAFALDSLLDALQGKLKSIPPWLPLEVYLRFAPEIDAAVQIDLWVESWHARALPRAHVELLPADVGLMALDSWLDHRGGPHLEKIVLIASVQLYACPLHNSAEAAVALLLGWPPLIERHGLKSVATLHRPVQCESEASENGVSIASTWGDTCPEAVNHLWQAGLSQQNKTRVSLLASQCGLGALQRRETSGMYDIDSALGYAGVSADWLALTLAIEYAIQAKEAQMISCGARALQFAVVRPPLRQEERETGR